jgi:Glycosyl transferase family 2
MLTPDSAVNRPVVSVIVPARNEEASLGRCLQSLVGQTGVSFEIIVVDDESADRTREIAQSFAGVRVIDAGPLPPGWTGKNNAVWSGSKQARGEWLLFTDADTVHAPGSLARSVAEAQQHQAALLSYSPEQEVRGFWEKAVMPVIFAELAATYRPSQVSAPDSPAAAANGQYLLVSRDAYDAVGGHAAVATSLLEDVALARAVKTSGRRIFFRYGGDRVSTRMYRSFSQLQEGWTKNLVLLFASPGRLALLRLTEFALIVGSAVVAVVDASLGHTRIALIADVLTVVLSAFLLKRIRRAHFSWDANILAPLGLPISSYLLLRSRLFYKRGNVTWKGRSYGSAGTTLAGGSNIHVGTAATACPERSRRGCPAERSSARILKA